MQKLTFFVSDTSIDMVMLLPIWPAQIRDHGDAIVAVTILNIADAVLEIFNRAFRLALKKNEETYHLIIASLVSQK